MNHALKKKQADTRSVHIFDGEVEPSMPDRSNNNRTILGIDSNDNHIRDDVEIWINRTGKNSNERKALRKYARSQYEYFIEVNNNYSGNSNGTSLKEKLLNDIADASECVDYIFNYPGYSISYYITKKIESLMSNTNLRDDASWEYYNNSSFAHYVGGRGDSSSCDFKVEAEELIKESNRLREELFYKKQKEIDEIKKKNNEENSKVRQQKNSLIYKSRQEQKSLIRIND